MRFCPGVHLARPPGHPCTGCPGVHRHRGAAARRLAQALCYGGDLSAAVHIVHARRRCGFTRLHAAAGCRAGRNGVVDAGCAARGRPRLRRCRVRQARPRCFSRAHAAGGCFADDGGAGVRRADGPRRHTGADHAGNRYGAGAVHCADFCLRFLWRGADAFAVGARRETFCHPRRLAPFGRASSAASPAPLPSSGTARRSTASTLCSCWCSSPP